MEKSFQELNEREFLALPISLGEEDERMYGEFAQRIRDSSPATAHVIAALSARRGRRTGGNCSKLIVNDLETISLSCAGRM
jgi:hypothetical protein